MGLLGRLLGDRPHVAVLVDGPNVLREEFDVDIETVRDVATADAHATALRLYLDEHASPGLIRAAEVHGFEAVVTSGDVDVKLAIDATDLVAAGRIDTLVIVSRDADFKPVFDLAGEAGVRTIAVAPGEHGRSAALSSAADESITIEPRQV